MEYSWKFYFAKNIRMRSFLFQQMDIQIASCCYFITFFLYSIQEENIRIVLILTSRFWRLDYFFKMSVRVCGAIFVPALVQKLMNGISWDFMVSRIFAQTLLIWFWCTSVKRLPCGSKFSISLIYSGTAKIPCIGT